MTEIHRGDILKEAHDLTTQDRNKQYGEPEINLSLAAILKHHFWKRATREFSPAEHEAIDMVLTKLSRIGTGTYKKDNYVDGAAYIAIAGQMGSLALVESGVMAEPPKPELLHFGKNWTAFSPDPARKSEFIRDMAHAKTTLAGNVAWDELDKESLHAIEELARQFFFGRPSRPAEEHDKS